MQPGATDGFMSPATSQAVRSYAGLAGLQSDGTVTPDLLRQLRQDARSLGNKGSNQADFSPTRAPAATAYRGPTPQAPFGAALPQSQPVLFPSPSQAQALAPIL